MLTKIIILGFDVIFSLLGEYNKNATVDMKNIGEYLSERGSVNNIFLLTL